MKTTNLLLGTLLPAAALALLPVDAAARTSFGISVDLGGVAWGVHRSRHHTVTHMSVVPAVSSQVVYRQAVVQPQPVVYAPAVVQQPQYVVVQQPAQVVYAQPVVYSTPVVYAPQVVYASPVVYAPPRMVSHRPVRHCPRTRYVPRRPAYHRPVRHGPSRRHGGR